MRRLDTFYITPEINDIWAAAAHAQRINGAYIKYDEGSKTANKSIMLGVLNSLEKLTPEDHTVGLEMQKYVKGLTMTAITRPLNGYERSMVQTRELDGWHGNRNYELAILCSIPQSFQRQAAGDTAEARIRETDTKHFGQLKARMNLVVNVIRCIYSKKWTTNFVTAVTADDNIVFFSYDTTLETGADYLIKGTVKAHRDNGQTQLNRVKIDNP